MIRLADNCPCLDCDHYKGIKQPKGDESIEYPYCTEFDEIPKDIILGEKCKKQETD